MISFFSPGPRKFTLLTLTAFLLIPVVHGQTNAHPESVLYWPTNSYWTALGIDSSLYDSPYHLSLFKPQNGEDGARVWSQTKSMLFYGAGAALFLAALPESATGWDSDWSLIDNWVENVKEGPVWDRDNWAYNYIGHAYVGGVYYQVARKSGYRQWDSFVYTALMSTFFWEYGVEAFAETPSIQDLVYTPIIGWIYGEWAYQTELKLRDNHNEVAGSKILGETSLFLLDPIDSFGRGVNRLAGRRWIKAGSGYFSYSATPDGTETDHTVYLNMKVPIGGVVDEKHSKETRKIKYNDDPINTSIIGISIGTGYTLLDNEWETKDDFYRKLTLGIYFTPRFSTRLGYAKSELIKNDTKDTVVYENYSLDAQYYLCEKQKLRPFITAGFGELMWEKNQDKKSFQWNAGLGLHWKLHKNWAVQTDWVNYYDSKYSTYDQNINMTLIYRFGQGERSDWY